jgi:hypothetical protein
MKSTANWLGSDVDPERPHLVTAKNGQSEVLATDDTKSGPALPSGISATLCIELSESLATVRNRFAVIECVTNSCVHVRILFAPQEGAKQAPIARPRSRVQDLRRPRRSEQR